HIPAIRVPISHATSPVPRPGTRAVTPRSASSRGAPPPAEQPTPRRTAPAATCSQHLLCREAAGGTHDPATGMRGGAAQPEPVDRRPEPCPTGDGAIEEELLEGRFALEDVAFRKAHLAFDVERR